MSQKKREIPKYVYEEIEKAYNDPTFIPSPLTCMIICQTLDITMDQLFEVK